MIKKILISITILLIIITGCNNIEKDLSKEILTISEKTDREINRANLLQIENELDEYGKELSKSSLSGEDVKIDTNQFKSWVSVLVKDAYFYSGSKKAYLMIRDKSLLNFKYIDDQTVLVVVSDDVSFNLVDHFPLMEGINPEYQESSISNLVKWYLQMEKVMTESHPENPVVFRHFQGEFPLSEDKKESIKQEFLILIHDFIKMRIDHSDRAFEEEMYNYFMDETLSLDAKIEYFEKILIEQNYDNIIELGKKYFEMLLLEREELSDEDIKKINNLLSKIEKS